MTWTDDYAGDRFATSPQGRRYRYHPLGGLWVNQGPQFNPISGRTSDRWDRVPSDRLYSDADATEAVLAYEAQNAECRRAVAG